MKRFSSKGFTLVELMIVVAILGILSAVAVPAYFNYILRARQGEGLQHLLDVKTAQEKFYALNDRYQNAGTLTSADTIGNYVSFDADDTANFRFTISGNANTFSARGWFDLNEDANYQDCWRISGTLTEPQACAANDQEITFSIFSSLF